MHTHDDDRKLKKQEKKVNNKDIKKETNIKTRHILDYVQLSNIYLLWKNSKTVSITLQKRPKKKQNIDFYIFL